MSNDCNPNARTSLATKQKCLIIGTFFLRFFLRLVSQLQLPVFELINPVFPKVPNTLLSIWLRWDEPNIECRLANILTKLIGQCNSIFRFCTASQICLFTQLKLKNCRKKIETHFWQSVFEYQYFLLMGVK